ncbi:hypothetical protein BH10ACT9_BH10ACT9_22060 [soil metagenome]
MTVLSADDIDRELDTRAQEVDAMSANLVELDNHPGLTHVRRYPPAGITAQRWAVIEKSLTQLWEDLGRMTSILDSARALRSRGSRLDDDERAELTRWLRARPLEVSRQRVPLAQRGINSPREMVEYVGLADTADRMGALYPGVVEFLDSVDEIDSLIATGLAPLQDRLDAAGTSGPPEIAELLLVSATDPLSLTKQDIAARLTVIAGSVQRRLTEAAELAALQANWPSAVAAASAQLDELREATRHAAQVRAHVEESVVSGPLPEPADEEPALRAALTALATPDPQALRALQQRIGAARRLVAETEQLAQGLLDRRIELKGRLTAYQAKAARLGLGEDPDLLATGQIAAGLLSRKPCDLRSVTRAITDFQQTMTAKQGRAK